MKLLLVATVLLVACMSTPSLAAPLLGGEEAKAVLQAIEILLTSENLGRSELQQSGNATSAPSGTSSSECDIGDSDKVECGYFGITQAQCEANNCCWKESSVSGVPFCFHKVDSAPKCQTTDRVECGYFGINDVQCEYRGCCWSPTTASGQPWCYHGKALEPECQTDPADRTECGYLGISAERCKGNGCCWSPTSSSGSPWCFTKATATNAPTPATTSAPSSILEDEEAKAKLQAIRMLLASENHGSSELQQSGNATSGPSGAPSGECDIGDSDKVDCGYVGIIQAQCEANGCCWKESSVSGVPYCFYKVETAPRCQTDDRVDCGYYGINEAECEYRGCCWSPTTAGGQPWCYHEKALEPGCQTDPADRTECGYLGISAERCKGNGCCWSPTSAGGRPWCFLKATATNAPATTSPPSSMKRKLLNLLRSMNWN